MTDLFKKLNYKDHPEIVVFNSPDSFEPELKEMAKYAIIRRDPAAVKAITFALIFVTKKTEIDELIKIVGPKLQGDANLWFCYPKGTSKKYTCDFNRDTGWSSLGQYHLEGVRMVAIDEDWSAMRFRKQEYIKTLTRNEKMILSSSTKERMQKKGN